MQCENSEFLFCTKIAIIVCLPIFHKTMSLTFSFEMLEICWCTQQGMLGFFTAIYSFVANFVWQRFS